MPRTVGLIGPTTQRVYEYVVEHAPLGRDAARRIAASLGLSHHTVTDHLARLDAAGLVRWRRSLVPTQVSGAGFDHGKACAVIALFRAGYLRNAEPADVCRAVGISTKELLDAANRPIPREGGNHAA